MGEQNVPEEPRPNDEPTDLPDKPAIEEMPPPEGAEPLTEEEEAQDEDPDFLDHTRAEADDTIDTGEEETYPDAT